ncbi:MAG: hypothetical protein NC543_09270 [bacterium]|nr:hypothetical protein [bacterium]MCM1375712.1 hypothetical protein [Muribaculum sp.]
MPLLEYYPRLYLGEGINREKLEKLKRVLAVKPKKAGVYLLTLPRNATDQLDIYESGYLQQAYYDRNPLYVIGIAADYEEAVEIVRQIAGETWAARGDGELRRYLTADMGSADVECGIENT